MHTDHAALVLIFFLRKKHDQPRAASMINRGQNNTPRG
jgi:hypothetical protein